MNREAIYGASFALAASAPGLVTTSRKLKHWNDVSSSEMPALFQAQGKETLVKPAINGLPSVWMLEATLYLYVWTEGADGPGQVLNPLLDGITSLFDANVVGAPQTLGALVQWARIEGTIETSEGTLGNLEVCLIPIRMLAT